MKGLRFVASIIFAGIDATPSIAVDWQSPWIEPQDTTSAIYSPDEYAWRVFVALNWPATLETRQSDPAKKLGADGPVTWETWMNARDVFLRDGSDPGPWFEMASVASTRGAKEFDEHPLQQTIRSSPELVPKFDIGAAVNKRNETRLNRQTYEFVLANQLFNLDGQLALFDRGVQSISFPPASKEIKAQWREIKEQDKSRYHWHQEGEKIYGLTAMHITTKDVPNWFWATFEHVENPKLPDNEGWRLESRDSFACKDSAPTCNMSPKGIGLENTKWSYYRLRGVQTDFVDARGNMNRLANSQPEQGFQTSSSCITCHARATIGRESGLPKRLTIFKPDRSGYMGTPSPEWYSSRTLDVLTNQITSSLLFTQLDFVWALARAQPKK
jgi:hypothetical protein